jgi:hypothetical protein
MIPFPPPLRVFGQYENSGALNLAGRLPPIVAMTKNPGWGGAATIVFGAIK